MQAAREQPKDTMPNDRPMTFTAVIADDEPLLRAQLRTRLALAWPALVIVGEASTGAEALALCEEHAPSVVFLDIHMPVMNGLDAATLIARSRTDSPTGAAQQTHIVFVTAYDQHALAAFDRGAIDYLLKPYEDARLQEAVMRVQERLAASHAAGERDSADALATVLAQLSNVAPSTPRLRWIKASVGQTVRLIDVDEVVYFQSDEKYTRVVLADQEVLIRKPIKELLAELDPDRFWQIHRSTLVNTRAIAGVVRGLRDQADLRLKMRPETLTVSRNFTHLFKQM
jgi:DNA-binding LytR/AlgR family response regulator